MESKHKEILKMVKLEVEDIQGIIRRGYGNLEEACFLMLEIVDAAKAKKWIGEIADKVRDGTMKPEKSETCINIAFTQEGFDKLGLQNAFHEDKRFSIEFEDGMVTKHRTNILGDSGDSEPYKWDWGNPTKDRIHIVLLLYAGDQNALDKLYEEQQKAWDSNGIKQIIMLNTIHLPDTKEHFGFRDGIAQPHVAGLLDRHKEKKDQNISQKILKNGGSENNILAAGEFVLGYPNIYKKLPSSPKVKKSSDSNDFLQDDGEGAKDLGRNGSYLVFRQLKQHVGNFWEYLDDSTKTNSGESDADSRDKLGAKMVGRWRSGCPVALSPDKDDPNLKDADDFGYFPLDKDGDKCPMASHVRRTNPRNSPLLRGDHTQEAADSALNDANRHRILRRGRAYGKPSADSMEPEDILKAYDGASEDVGLQFLCFNANIGRQFEFIQHTWINNPKFAELYSESDPLLGESNPKSIERGIYGDFTAPGNPIRQRVRGLKRFVDVKGGAYFFMPGIKALKYLAKLS